MLNDKDNVQRMIDMELHKLDCVATETESKWGVGNLYDYANDELRGKWDSQMKKLADAVKANEYFVVKNLVDGCIRGWGALEANAEKLGKEPIEPDYMEVKLDSGFHIRIARSVSEARGCTQDGVVVLSLKEVARLIQARYKDVYDVKKVFPDAEVTEVESFDFNEGDNIPL